MDALKAIKTRRSIREYSSEKVDESHILEILEAAMCAPSAGNQQPWHFVVVDDRKILDEIHEVHPYSSMLKQVSVAVVVCGDTKAEKFKGFWVQDCSAAVENMLIAANAKGLGAVWLGVYPREERVKGIQRILSLPEYVIPLAVVPLGYPLKKPPQIDRFNRSRIHRNRW